MSQPSSGSIQSRRFLCHIEHEGDIIAAFRVLQTIPTVTYIVRSKKDIYTEVSQKQEHLICRICVLLCEK